MFKTFTEGPGVYFSVSDTMPIQCSFLGLFSGRFLSLSNFGVFPFWTLGHSGSPFQCPSCLQSAHRLDALRGPRPEDEDSALLDGLPGVGAGLPAPLGAKLRDKRWSFVFFFARHAAKVSSSSP